MPLDKVKHPYPESLFVPNLVSESASGSFNRITALSTVIASPLGTAAIGTSTAVARADHVHSSTIPTAISVPRVNFTGGTSTISALALSDGTLSFESTLGQLFSITNSLTGVIFSVNDISGLPAIEVVDTGLIRFNETYGQVVFGATSAVANTQISAIARTSATIPLVTRGASGQSVNLQEWQSSTPTTVASMSVAGALTLSSTISASGLAGSLLSSTAGAALGAASAGSLAVPARADHVHPSFTPTNIIGTVAGTSSLELVRGNMADNDNFRILIGGTASNAGFVEIATADDANEPIYIRQYSGAFSTLIRTLTLLDGSGNTLFPGQIQSTLANSTTTGGGQIYLNGTTGNRIDFNTNGVAAPAFTTRSAGTKVTLFPNIDATNVDYALGIESNTMWFSVPQAIAGFTYKWYAGTTNIATLTGAGALTLSSTATATSFIPSGSSVPSNGMYLSAANTLNFATNTTNRLGIDSSGNSTFTGTIIAPAATTTLAPIRIPHGTAPTSPTNGDVWTTTAGMYVRINGATVGPLGSGGGGGSGTVTSIIAGTGLTGGTITTSGTIAIDTTVVPRLTAANTFTVAPLQLTIDNAANKGIIIRAASSQTANLEEWQNSAGTVLASMSSAGAFTAVSKSFDIPHPTKENMRLRYGSLEGPENGVYIRGKSTNKIIALPDYWTGLVDSDSITVQLTAIGIGTVYVDFVANNSIKVGGTAEEFYYFIQAERKDIDKLIVEY